jgi:hypothetical protein
MKKKGNRKYEYEGFVGEMKTKRESSEYFRAGYDIIVISHGGSNETAQTSEGIE